MRTWRRSRCERARARDNGAPPLSRLLEGFERAEVETDETSIFVRWSGTGEPILLLHGFPQTHLMWHGVAPLLARRFTVVCADLRGSGGSGCPTSTPNHAPYAKRGMARDMVSVMERLGFPRFSVAGHDRGGRVAYRLALDHPNSIERLAVLDVLPTGAVEDVVAGWGSPSTAFGSGTRRVCRRAAGPRSRPCHLRRVSSRGDAGSGGRRRRPG